ncbi:HAD-IIB family hydrolase [Chitinivibrio alkaliphilus]|uniref:HAD-superfamily hydrolase, subfamily IIB n=1 Tax=Chitinivibrio alkaliphilus ACht1 TaxID=1313304 RepID=U7DAL6_9BACT|nr:HAD-IIB family hydrolase [Chitinivibrio alkaliphilus]ERP32172.1 HAD-superfamily hydrolase, subfamily IIB [Chitinivibrio alkaliphilus ACht1]
MAFFFITDLDGTLIPNRGSAGERAALQEILRRRKQSSQLQLTYASGRNHALIIAAIQTYALPEPDYLIADVGTSVYIRREEGFFPSSAYHDVLAEICAELPVESLKKKLSPLPIQAQDESNNGPFKASYTVQPQDKDGVTKKLAELLRNTPWEPIISRDHREDYWLIDLVPTGVSKLFAISWLTKHLSIPVNEQIYAGDSGNDHAVFMSTIPSIIVGNTPEELKKEARTIEGNFIAQGEATEGVLEGLNYFNWK